MKTLIEAFAMLIKIISMVVIMECLRDDLRIIGIVALLVLSFFISI